MNKHRDEIMSWWDSRPRRDRRGNLRAIERKDGKVAHLYRYYLNGKIQSAVNFSHKWTLKEVQAVIARIEAEIHKEEVAARMGFPAPGVGEKIKPITLLELIEWHLKDIMLRAKPRTIKNYERAFTDFMDFVGDTDTLVSAIDLKKIYAYRDHLKAKRNSTLTIANRLKIIRAVFSNARYQFKITDDPFDLYRGEKIQPSEERGILTAVEMRQIADMIKSEKKKYWPKIWLAWQLARYAGIRGGDILRLKFENINFEDRTMSFPIAKLNDYVITIPVHHSLFAILEKLRGKKGKIFQFEDFIWAEQILTKRFGYYIRKLKGKDFIKPGSHTPRHSRNQIMLDNDIPYEYRCYLIGQSVIGTQAKYLHKKQKSHLDKLRSIIESLPLD